MLAVKMMLGQGIEVIAVNFTGPFCNCSPRKEGCKHQAKRVAEELGIPIRVIPKGMDYMKMVENPPHGYGRGMNPCIDCRIYMLRKAKELMASMGASFIVTGEVLGQRPMSQHRQTLQLIEKESGLQGFIIRPLSAQHFSPTLPELEGLVDRQRLLAISGRSRKSQIQLAKNLGLRDYPCPAGGCLLTDRLMASRLRDIFFHIPNYTIEDLLFLRIGRHFRLSPRLKLIVGRNREENERIWALAPRGSILFHPAGFRGPIALARGILDLTSEKTIGEILARFSQDGKNCYLIRKQVVGGEEAMFSVEGKFAQEKLRQFCIGGQNGRNQ